MTVHTFTVLYRSTPGPGQLGASNDTNENFLYISKTDIDGNTVDFSYIQTAVDNGENPEIYNLNGAYGTTSRFVATISDLGTFYDLYIYGDPVEGTGGRGWPYSNCRSGCDPTTNSFPDGAQMVLDGQLPVVLPTPYEYLDFLVQPDGVPLAQILDFDIDGIKEVFGDYPVINQPWLEGGSGGEECPDDRPNSGMLYPRG